MPRLRQSVVVRATPQQVFAALASVEDIPKFVPQVVAARLITQGPVRVGTRFEQLVRFAGARAAVLTEVTQAHAPRRFGYRGLTGFRYEATYSLSEEPGGTRVDYAVTASVPWYAALASPWVARLLRRSYLTNMATFAERLERHGSLRLTP